MLHGLRHTPASAAIKVTVRNESNLIGRLLPLKT